LNQSPRKKIIPDGLFRGNMVLKAAKGLNYNIFDTSTPAKNYLIFSFKKMKPFEANIYKYIVMNFHQNNTRQNIT
jgi:hypothetical protein